MVAKTDAQAPREPAAQRQLTVLDHGGPLALVETTSRFAGFAFHDLVLVAETREGWLIVDKVFERLAAGKPPRSRAIWPASQRPVSENSKSLEMVASPGILRSSRL